MTREVNVPAQDLHGFAHFKNEIIGCHNFPLSELQYHILIHKVEINSSCLALA